MLKTQQTHTKLTTFNPTGNQMESFFSLGLMLAEHEYKLAKAPDLAMLPAPNNTKQLQRLSFQEKQKVTKPSSGCG